MPTFSKRLKELRIKHNLTQKQLSAETQISERGIQNYEGEKRKPTFDIIIKLADYFNIPADYFLCRGLFENWEDIMEHKDEILFSIQPYVSKIMENSNLSPITLSELDELDLIQALDIFIKRVEISPETETIQVFYKI